MALHHPLHHLDFADLLAENRRARPDRLAVVDGDVRLTWTEFEARVDRVTGWLASEGVGHGDRVLWLGQNSYRILELLSACGRLGSILCPANWRQSAEEMRFVVDDLEPTVVVWQHGEIGERVAEARQDAAAGAVWVRYDTPADEEGYESRVGSAEPLTDTDPVDPGEPLLALYTAAFGGRPNAALLSHTALLTQDLVMGRMLEISDESVFLNSGPMFHIATLMVTTATIHHGGCNVFTPRSDAEEICRLVEGEAVTHAFLVRPTIEAMAEVNADGRFDLSTLFDEPDPDRHRGGIIGPAGCAWAQRPGGFGQTEVMGLTTFVGLGAAAEGTSGRSSPAALVRIVDVGGADVAPGDAGEIVVRGPAVMNGYFRRPELNAERSRGGWQHTGDLGRRESDGSISFVGPMLDMIKSASENIYPVEVEAALTSHPGVVAACVIGVPDPQWTQRVKAVVVRADGADPSEEELIEHCRERIASYKKPQEIEFVDELPRVGPGFVDRAAVNEAHGGGGYPGARR